MKSSNVHAILSDVHRLLSQYSPDDFVAASRYSGVSSSVRSALLALSREILLVRGGKNSEQVPGRRTSNRKRSTAQHTPARAEIVASILKSPRFPSSRAITEYAAAHGLAIRAEPKDGKRRLAKRLATKVESASEKERADLLAAIGLERESQTQGWIDVIKSPRR